VKVAGEGCHFEQRKVKSAGVEKEQRKKDFKKVSFFCSSKITVEGS
jgi:hypothetical protein